MGTHKKDMLTWSNKWDRMWEELTIIVKSVVKCIQHEAWIRMRSWLEQDDKMFFFSL